MALHDPHVFDHPEEPADSTASEPVKTFGRYLLFKRLQRNGLGEIYRAGVMGENAIERMVTLRLFNAAGIDGETFHAACESRSEVPTVLRGGHFGEVVERGREGSVAFVAHEYVPGRTVAELMLRARETGQPVPLEHALQIMDRVAISLQNAAQLRLDEARLHHGFLIPEFVHVSTEGEIQLHGFELSPGLLQLPETGPARSHLTGYIAPEVNAGQPPSATDDVYSLGAMFAELLTGEPLPALNPAESSRWVEAAMLADEGTPLPEAIRNLLRDSLLPRDQRIKKAERWHQSLVAIVNASDCSPTTFNLAFFVHTLFGDDLDREALAVEAERRAEVPPPVSEPMTGGSTTEAATEPAGTEPLEAEPPPAEPAEPPPATEPDPAIEVEADGDALPAGAEQVPLSSPVELKPPPSRVTQAARSQSAQSEGPNKTIWIGAAALVVVALAVGWFVFGRADTPPPAPIEVTAAPPVELPTEPTVVDELAVAPPLAPEEIEDQVRDLVAQRAGALEANLKAEYDERLVELRKQLEAARKTAESTTRTPAAESRATTTPTRPEPAPRETVVQAQPERRSPATVPEGPAQAQRQVTAETTEPTPPPTARPTSQPTLETSERVADVGDARTAPPSTAQSEPARTRPVAQSPQERTAGERTAAARTETVEPGAIVTQGPGVSPPRMTQQPRAVYPPAAARLKRQATVKLRVLVDENGQPSEVERVGKEIGLGFDQAALRAARTSRWTPPTKDGVPVKMWVELSIDFRP